MDDGRLDRVEEMLVRHARNRQVPELPADFTASVMRAVRNKADKASGLWDVFSVIAWRFVPAGALAATAMYGFAVHAESAFSLALLRFSLTGGGSLTTLAALIP